MKKLFFPAFISLAASLFLFSGCAKNSSTTGGSLQNAMQGAGGSTTGITPSPEAMTTKTGHLLHSGQTYLLQIPGQPAIELNSYQIDLSQYADKTITVTGQYSGDTLFVSSIK